jgi:hypothetical protein
MSISACGSGSSGSGPAQNLDTARIAASIEQSILSERHVHAKVTCPVAVPQEAGRVFTCIATGTSGKSRHKTSFRTPFTVTVKSDRGYVEYHS